VVAPIWTGAVQSKLPLCAKCASVYLLEKNRIPCVRAQARHFSCASFREVQFSAVVFPYVSKLTSSAKPSSNRRRSGKLRDSSKLEL
jgi:hypothetical protein